MGNFADSLAHRIRARKNARLIKHPSGAGVVMWCAQCRAQILRTPTGKAPTLRAQKNAVAAHERSCTMRDLPRTPLAAIEPRKQRRRVVTLIAAALLVSIAAIIAALFMTKR